MGKRKAERILEKKQQHALNEHELDLFLNTTPISDDILTAADKDTQVATTTAASSQEAPTATDSHEQLHTKNVDVPATENALLPGMVLLKRFLLPSEQQQLVIDAQKLGLEDGGFYKPTYASGAKCRLHQMCLGRHWNVVTEQYEQIRTNFDHAQVPSLPETWKAYALKSLEAAIAVDPLVMGTCTQQMEPDICVVNYYKKAGRNGMHIDKDESEEAMEKGSPVISFSIGATAEFAYIDHYPKDGEAVPIVTLESGDVLVFGGPSRKLVHALTRVYPNTEPSWLRMRSGRLNLTFREYKPKE